jgi:hypothetical protein
MDVLALEVREYSLMRGLHREEADAVDEWLKAHSLFGPRYFTDRVEISEGGVRARRSDVRNLGGKEWVDVSGPPAFPRSAFELLVSDQGGTP